MRGGIEPVAAHRAAPAITSPIHECQDGAPRTACEGSTLVGCVLVTCKKLGASSLSSNLKREGGGGGGELCSGFMNLILEGSEVYSTYHMVIVVALPHPWTRANGLDPRWWTCGLHSPEGFVTSQFAQSDREESWSILAAWREDEP